MDLKVSAKVGKAKLKRLLCSNIEDGAINSTRIHRMPKSAIKLYIYLHFLPIRRNIIGRVSLNVTARDLGLDHQTVRAAVIALTNSGYIQANCPNPDDPYMFYITLPDYEHIFRKKQAGYITLSSEEAKEILGMNNVNTIRYSLYAILSSDTANKFETQCTFGAKKLLSRYITGKKLKEILNNPIVQSNQLIQKQTHDRRYHDRLYICTFLKRPTQQDLINKVAECKRAAEGILKTNKSLIPYQKTLQQIIIGLSDTYSIPQIVRNIIRISRQYIGQSIQQLPALISDFINRELLAYISGCPEPPDPGTI